MRINHTHVLFVEYALDDQLADDPISALTPLSAKILPLVECEKLVPSRWHRPKEKLPEKKDHYSLWVFARVRGRSADPYYCWSARIFEQNATPRSIDDWESRMRPFWITMQARWCEVTVFDRFASCFDQLEVGFLDEDNQLGA